MRPPPALRRYFGKREIPSELGFHEVPLTKEEDNLDDLESWLYDLWKFVELCSCKIETGLYSGDGTTSKTITTNFIPLVVFVWAAPEDNIGSACAMWMRCDQSTDQASLKHLGAGGHEGINNALISIDTSTPGFVVDDAGSDANPNKDGSTYHYLVLG